MTTIAPPESALDEAIAYGSGPIPLISILIPVLDRPDNAAKVATSIREVAQVDTEILFLLSPDDPDELHAVQETGERYAVVVWPAGDGDYARKINAGYRMTQGEWIFTAADDLTFHDNWDLHALASANGFSVIGTQDLCNGAVKRGRHSTHTLVRREYVRAVGSTFSDGPDVVLHEGYSHQWVDVELVAAAQGRAEWIFAGDSVVEHHHPICGEAEMDDTYRKSMLLGDGRADRRVYARRHAEFRRQHGRRR